MSVDIRELLEQWRRRPITAFSGAVTVLLSIWGVFGIYREIAKEHGSPIAMVAVTLPLLCVIIFLIALVVWSRRWGLYLPLEQRYLFSDVKQHWHIKANGQREVYAERTYIFYRPPKPEDLTEQLFGSLDLEYIRMNYSSPDADIVDIERIANYAYRIFWQPKEGSIEIGRPYVHSFSYLYPKGDDSNNKSITVATSVYTSVVEIKVTTEKPITWFHGYKGGALQRFTSFESIKKGALKAKRTNAPPVSCKGDTELTWQLKELEPGLKYFLVWETENV